MKNVIFLMISLLILPGIGACGQSTEGEKQNLSGESEPANTVEVYYFHFTRRCVTCVNVQKATEKVLKDHYGDELENGSIVYNEINLSEPESRETAQMLGVGGQALLVTCGDKKHDLTMQGFMLASRDYNQFKDALDEAIKRVKN
jgi:hypothetical protein